MSLSDELSKRLESVKKEMTYLTQMLGSFDVKKQIKESETSQLEYKIDKLKKELEANQNKANDIVSKASSEATEILKKAKESAALVEIEKSQISEDKKKAQQILNEAQALMSQANQKAKDADVMYRTYYERHKKLSEALG